MDHYKNPRNKGSFLAPDREATDKNTSCDDKIKVQVRLEKNKIKDIKFDGVGCAISIASASMLTENVKGKTIQEISKMNHQDIYDLVGIKLDPVRTRCAALGLQTLKKALGNGK